MNEQAFARCDFCSTEIPLKEFQQGRAVKVLGKNYCAACMAEAIKRARNPETAPDLRTPRPHPPMKHENRRRHVRKPTSIAVELSIYLADGQLYDRGEALLANVSLSGALLGALVLSQKPIPVAPHTIGIRLLEGLAKDLEIIGRPVRFVHVRGGSEVGIEFLRTEETQLKQLRKIV